MSSQKILFIKAKVSFCTKSLMKTNSLILSSLGLKNILQDDKEFTFIFGEQKFSMNNLNSEFISPIISHLHHSDPTINTICFKCKTNFKKEPIISEDIINLLKEISSGQKVEIHPNQGQKLRILSILLGNDELFKCINKIYPLETKSANNDELFEILEFIDLEQQNTGDFLNGFDELFDSISTNFCNLDKEKLISLPTRVLYKVITNEHLKITSEDSLLDFINELFESKEKVENNELGLIEFYEQIDIKNLSEEKFASFLLNLDRNEVTGGLWSRLLERFIPGEKKEVKKGSRYYVLPGKKFLFDGKEENRMSGIIRYLTNEAGGNVHDKGVVVVSGSSECGGNDRHSKFAVDLDNKQTRFASKNEENSWLQYNFKDRKIHPTHYSIRSKPCGKNDWNPCHWVIEGSNTGNNDWKVLDTRSDIKVLDDTSVTHTFDIQEHLEPNECYQFLRIRQTGKNAASNNHLGLSALEYFGTIIENQH